MVKSWKHSLSSQEEEKDTHYRCSYAIIKHNKTRKTNVSYKNRNNTIIH